MEGDLQHVVGRNLRAYGEARGLSQEAFAEIVGVHRTYMGGLQRGERNLMLRSLEHIAAVIRVDPLALLRATSRSVAWDAHGGVAIRENRLHARLTYAAARPPA